ncbi:8-amino-7-oxononanoate synthase [Crocinitomix sp.]|nr:8-amino-7-oxononanoate synthase [Crocinitomix sp.]
MKSPKHIKLKLDERKADNAFRSLNIYPDGIDFFSNDYLGLSKIPFESKLAHGSTGSRLISGHSIIAEKFEKEVAEFFNQPAAVLYNSGYDANVGLFSCIAQRGDTVIYDTLIHASIRDGIRLSNANSYNFKHNDLNHLENRLKKGEGTVFVAIESIYSMDGDEAQLAAISKLCVHYGAFLIVDEAHACGVYGSKGCGLVSHYNLDDQIFAKIITFGKGYGSHGATVLGNIELKAYLVNFSRALIYTTGLPPSVIERLSFVLDQVSKMDKEREKLFENIKYFQSKAAKLNLALIKSESAIQSVLIPGNKAVKKTSDHLASNGINAKAILSPTVERNGERIRICMHSYNTFQEIDQLLDVLK